MDKLSIRKLFERAKANDTIAQEELYEYYYERYHSFVILDKRIPNMEEIYIESIKNAVSRSISNPDSTLDSTQKLVKSTFINKIKIDVKFLVNIIVYFIIKIVKWFFYR